MGSWLESSRRSHIFLAFSTPVFLYPVVSSLTALGHFLPKRTSRRPAPRAPQVPACRRFGNGPATPWGCSSSERARVILRCTCNLETSSRDVSFVPAFCPHELKEGNKSHGFVRFGKQLLGFPALSLLIQARPTRCPQTHDPGGRDLLGAPGTLVPARAPVSQGVLQTLCDHGAEGPGPQRSVRPGRLCCSPPTSRGETSRCRCKGRPLALSHPPARASRAQPSLPDPGATQRRGRATRESESLLVGFARPPQRPPAGLSLCEVKGNEQKVLFKDQPGGTQRSAQETENPAGRQLGGRALKQTRGFEKRFGKERAEPPGLGLRGNNRRRARDGIPPRPPRTAEVTGTAQGAPRGSRSPTEEARGIPGGLRGQRPQPPPQKRSHVTGGGGQSTAGLSIPHGTGGGG